ncbi:MAG TPA: SGNH/GDSL hydrolase family protein [Actinoplanes sp.]|nr:SGNH/GDSL hydrolase family protein [Actinoplanes sp.]
MSRRTTVLACLVTSTVLILIPAAPAAAAADDIDYIAMGDSYSSGVGAPGQAGLCLRSSRSYTTQWAARNDPASYRTVACGGAKTGDVLSRQVPYLNGSTDLITITIGGNDAGFADTVISCTFGSDSTCLAKINQARDRITGTLPGALDRTYRAIREKAPNARVFVMGYPRLFDVSRPVCLTTGMSLTKRRALNAGADDLAGIIADRAAAAGFTFVDVRDDFQGHGACATSPWINGLTILPPTDSFHPNTAGYTNGYLPAMAAAVD